MNQPKPKRTTNSRVFMWDNATKDWTDALPQGAYSPRHPAFLWKECWEQFNLMKIPILTDDEYYRIAMEVTKDENVTSGEEFKRCFQKQMMFRQAKWKKMSDKVCHRIVCNCEAFPCKDAWRKVENAYKHRCYMTFMDLLEGVALGWEPDASVDIPFDGTAFYDDYYDGYIGHDYDSHIHPGGEPTQIGERSQRKRKKNAHFDGITDDDNRERSKRQRLERSTADSSSSYTSSSSTEYVQGETAARMPDNQILESHIADSISSRASTSSTEILEEESPAQRFRRQREEPPAADSPFSFAPFSIFEDAEERPAEGAELKLPESDTAESLLPHASSSHTTRVEGERPAQGAKRRLSESDTAESLLPHASSSHTKRVEEERPAKRVKRQIPEPATADPLPPDNSSSSPEHIDKENSAIAFKRQGREFVTADSSLSPIPSYSTRNAQRPAKRSRRQMSRSRTTDPSTTRTSRRNKGSVFWELDHNGKPKEI